MSVVFTESEFDHYIDPSTGKSCSVRLFTWTNHLNTSIDVITYGATITSIKLPDKNGSTVDVVMGFSNMDGYLNPLNPYFGATVGRYANRIAFGRLKYFNPQVNLSKNHGQHHLHGGYRGFDKVNWEAYTYKNRLILSYYSADEEEGYPGDLVVHAMFELTQSNNFMVEYRAMTTKPTPINISNHSYFNLAGHSAGKRELYEHLITIHSEKIVVIDSDNIPTGELLDVDKTVFDLRKEKYIGVLINDIPNCQGFDHNYCIHQRAKSHRDREGAFVARVSHPKSGRFMDIYSNQPGVQFYTSNFLPKSIEDFDGDLSDLKVVFGKEGNYYKHGAFCLETQNWPDAPNHKNFPESVLNPGQRYTHSVIYKFGILDNADEYSVFDA